MKDLLYVQWVDSVAISGWKFPVELDETLEVEIIQSIGWIYKDTDEYLALYGHTAVDPKNEQYSQVMVIPKIAIIKRVPLVFNELIHSMKPESLIDS